MTRVDVIRAILPAVVGAAAAYAVERWYRLRKLRRLAASQRADGSAESPESRDHFDEEPEA